MKERKGYAFFDSDLQYVDFLWAYGVSFYAFHLHDILLSVLKPIEAENIYNTISTPARAQFTPLIIYLLVSYMGYTTYLDKTPTLIFRVVNLDLEGEYRIFLGIATLCLLFNILLSIGYRIRTCVEQLILIID